MGYQSYRDLDIYKLSHKLAIEVHQMTLMLPKFELYEEDSQVRRASKSICNNIVEGFGRRRYKNEFIQFLTYALASCDETREHLNFFFETGSFNDKKGFDYFLEGYDHLGKMLTNFVRSVEQGHLTHKKSLSSIEHLVSSI